LGKDAIVKEIGGGTGDTVDLVFTSSSDENPNSAADAQKRTLLQPKTPSKAPTSTPTPSPSSSSSGSHSSSLAPKSPSSSTPSSHTSNLAPKSQTVGTGSTTTGGGFTLQGKWVAGKNAGGSPTQISWKTSPQYILEISSTCNVEISLSQQRCPDGKFLHIGFLVFKADLPTKKKKINTRDLVHQGQFINSEKVTDSITLESGTYNIIACTYQPNMENSYTLSVSAPCLRSQAEFYELTPELDWKYVTAKGEWKAGKDGGCSNSPNTFTQNPHFLLTCPQKQFLKILLETEHDVPIGFYVFTTKDGKHPDEALSNSPFVNGMNLGRVTTFKDFPDFGPGKYLIRPTTFTPHVQDHFTIHVLAEKVVCQISEVL